MRALWVFATLIGVSTASAQNARFAVGEATLYAIEYANSAHSDLRPLFGTSTSSAARSPLVRDTESELKGTLEQRVLLHDSVVHIAFSFRDASVLLKVNSQNAPASDTAIIRAGLQRPMFAVLSKAGKLISTSFDSLVDDRARVLARAVLTSMEFVVPPGSNQDAAWNSQEQDMAGVYEASYVIHGNSVTKRRISYMPQTPQRTRGGRVPAAQTIQPGGSATAQFDAAGRLMGVDSYELQTVTVAKRPIANSVTKFRLRKTATKKMSSADLTRFRALERKTLKIERKARAQQ